MASFKKPGQMNLVAKGQHWKNVQTGRIWKVVGKAGNAGGKSWIITKGDKCHHVHEGTMLKFFSLQK